jgi:aminoglycoside phosphotransferase (APT) family kinase protein
MAGTVENLVHVADLGVWMDEQGLSGGPIENVGVLAGGTQNILLSFSRGGRSFILRRPPIHPRPESNETMRREARVLTALAGTNVPHPALIAACGDESVLGTAFYLMAPVDGFTATVEMPPLHACDPAVRRRMGLALVEGAAALGRVDHVAVGLSDFGKPANFLERQVKRWRSQLTGYASNEGWPGEAHLPGIGEISSYLEENCPTDFKPGLMHGDYSIGNVMYRRDSGELAAIIDWELTTIGDPLLDLGLLMALWPGDPTGELDVLAVSPWDGFPHIDEMVAHYAEVSGRNLDAVDWYAVLACFKQAIILEGSYARAFSGRDPSEIGERLHGTSRKLLLRALHRINRS